ncbi:hypothetical protein NLG97_g4700 [Lecanicillium saksenae]|uniref:Uncharacterized protein n=1 Tax=Lecanicillium saksenae TaxID=468837 RepID=A0ACC1QWE8_9HYPO|nr:hypothetical protein NLG97_g4700 [Lecanicillium saksenae]
MVQYPLAQSVAAYATVMTMVKSLGRIQEFLSTEENQDLRVVRPEASDVLAEKKTTQLETESLETQLDKHQRVAAQKSEDGGPLVEFTSADIAPTGHDTAILRSVSFAAKPGSLTAVVGGVGSGKSTLLHSIIGEADIRKGVVSIDRKEPVGYCDQHVWLRNASIRDNIVGPGPFDQNRYDQAMRLCRLNEDVEQFPEGNGYIVGNNGCNLSGGQRHRLSLARSFYLDTRFMVLDDVFSALDHPTAIAIFSDLFGANGAARKEGRTVILATHLPECLTDADQILSIDGKGNVSVQSGSRQGKQALDLLEILQQPGEEDAGATVSSDGSTKDALLAETAGGVQRVNFSRVSRIGLYGLFIRSMGVWLFAVYLVLQIMMSALEVLPDVYMRIWIEVAPKNKLYFIGYAGVALLCAVVGTISYGFFFIVIVPRTSMSLHKAFSETFMRSTLSFVTNTDSGSILNKYSQDMTILARALSALFSFCFYAFFGLVSQIAVILATSKWVAIAVAVLIVGSSALQYYYLRTSRQMRYLDLESHTPLYTQFLELSSGLRHIRAFGWEEELLAESFKLIDTSQTPFYTMYAIQQWLGFTLDCMSSILAIVMVIIATHLPQSTSQAALGLGFMHVITVGGTTCKLIEAWTKLETALGSLLRIYLFTIETPVEAQETVAKLPDVWPGAGKIEFEEVTARYNPDDDEKIALRNVSFAIAPGQKVGLRGRTGRKWKIVGKSSIFLTLLRFLEYSGKIVIDGVDVSTIAPDELRARLITISQHSVKFSGTVRNNLLPFNMNEKDEEKIKERDQEVQDELARLGLWELVQEKGGLGARLDDVGLSSGQLQMLCIARAILRYRDIGGKIVLVDEGTSNIDYETDAAIQKALKEAFADCTVITIAHRTNTIDDCDVQIELSKGEVVLKE